MKLPLSRPSMLRSPFVRLTGRAGAGGFLIQLPPMQTAHSHGPSLVAILLGVLLAAAGMLLGVLVAVVGKRVRRFLHQWRGRRRRMRHLQGAETRARVLMSELCPNGWRAQITLFGPDDELPPEAPDRPEIRVALDWAELDRERDRVAVVRRVWATSIAEALEAMLADRRTDETLEQIERGALTDGTLWPDL